MCDNVCKWSDEPLPYEWSWPKGVPRNYDELVRDHGDFVARCVARYNKVDRNFTDLLQEVWSKLIGSRVLEKFVSSGARRLPPKMTVLEARRFLGVSEKRWLALIYRKTWLPQPEDGDLCDMTATIATSDVIDIDKAFNKVRRGRRVRPPFTARGFKAYLQRSVHNAYANFCRTRSRRYKEQLLSPQAVLSQQSDGAYRQKTEIEEMSSWESNIATAMTLDEEDMIDLVGTLRRAKIDLDSKKGVEVLDFLIQQGRSCKDGPRRNLEVLDLLGHGYTLSEAVKRVQQRVRARVRVVVTG